MLTHSFCNACTCAMSTQQSRKPAGDWSALRTQVRELEDRLALLENVVDRIDEIDKTVNELKTTMRDCTCKLVVFKAVYIDEFMLFIVSASNSDRGRSDSPRAKDVVPLVSVQIIHAGNELTCTYASSAFLCRQFYRTRSTRTVMNWQRFCPHLCGQT